MTARAPHVRLYGEFTAQPHVRCGILVSLLHKGGGTTIHPSDWRPVVLMDGMNQLLGYIVLERLTRLTEISNVLESGQGGYREVRGGDLNMHKID